MKSLNVVSIGYEQRSPEELIQILLTCGVRKLLDVRELPLSRRRGFSKTALSASLSAAGIEYRHLRSAGNPHRKLKADIVHCLRLYKGYLRSHPDVVSDVAAEFDGSPVAILCYEREHEHCHRSILIGEIEAIRKHLHVNKVE